jgi:hypothetical protein
MKSSFRDLARQVPDTNITLDHYTKEDDNDKDNNNNDNLARQVSRPANRVHALV